MNRFIPSVPAVLVLGAWSLTAQADDAPSTTPPAVAAQATSSASSSPDGKAAPTRVSSTAGPASSASVQRLVCLNMSLQCFAIKPKAEDAPAQARAASLDLKAPDVRRVAPETQWSPPLTEPEIEEQQVQVEGTRPEVYVPSGIASLPWAVMHPTQAWRIFLPVPPGTAK
jgi:hypothetical protein